MALELENLFYKNREKQYVGVRLTGNPQTYWFETAKCTLDVLTFTGTEGWGTDMAETAICCERGEIHTAIFSNSLPH